MLIWIRPNARPRARPGPAEVEGAPVRNHTINGFLISDVAAAAEAARAAATTARVNIEINLAGISGTAARAELCAAANLVDRLTEHAERLTAAVRAELAR